MNIKQSINRIKKSAVVKNSSWIIAEKVFQMAIALFVNRAVAGYLQPDNFGTLNYGASIVAFFTSLCTLGLDAIVINAIINKPKEQGQIIGTSIFMRIISSILSMVGILIVISILKPEDSIIKIVTVLQSIALFFDSFNILQLWYQSKLKSKYISLIAFGVYILVAIFKVILVILKKEIIWFAFANTLTSILTMIFTYRLYKVQNGPKLEIKRDLIKPLISQSYHFILSGLMIAVYGQTDKIMIGSMMNNMSAVGFYSVATTITNLWSFIPSAIITSFRPTIIEAKKVSDELYIKRLKQLYSVILWLNILYALFITIFANLFINILYGPEYIEAKIPLLLAVWSGGFSYIGVARDIWFVSEGYQKYSKWISLMGCITNIILNFILIPIYGIIGAAIATTITQVMTGLISTLFFKETRKNTKYILEAFVFKFNVEKIKE